LNVGYVWIMIGWTWNDIIIFIMTQLVMTLLTITLIVMKLLKMTSLGTPLLKMAFLKMPLLIMTAINDISKMTSVK
jgi:hypothetical protein